ncbi:uncharacterized protein ATNIH1004_009576 [Aspergillus tanneri]|uniref:Uncharacterized protein n=1 Tax=Aspergillus tanneri TaxID=1220188 RepID=A0A5M9MD03_9EURO|nr:uncharacterized protein ATNIH1004_009576 [Aspergillus tanneri]KAA8642823.1 hypothetical protein ATNIH1004_009576 [Aspergillus tanneri]
MSAAVDIRFVETGDILDCLGETCVIRLAGDMIDEALLCEVVHYPGNEVTTQAVWLRIMQSEQTRSKSTTSHTPSTIAVAAAEPRQLIEDLGLKDGSGRAVRGCVLRPVPVSDHISVGQMVATE